MRTDSITLSKDSIDILREYIQKDYGDKYLPKILLNINQEECKRAHEAIRPTDISPNQMTSNNF